MTIDEARQAVQTATEASSKATEEEKREAISTLQKLVYGMVRQPGLQPYLRRAEVKE